MENKDGTRVPGRVDGAPPGATGAPPGADVADSPGRLPPAARLGADAALLSVAVIWGTAFVAQGIAARAGIAWLYNGASFLLAALILAPAALKRIRATSPRRDAAAGTAGGPARVAKEPVPPGARTRASARRLALVSVGAGSVLFAASALQQVGILTTEVANAGFLTSLYAVITPFLLWILFRERPAGLDIVAVFVAALGAWLLATGGAGLELKPGDILETAGAFFWALHFVVIAKFGNELDTIVFAAAQFLVCGLLNLGVGLLVEPVTVLLEGPVLVAVVYRAALSIGIGYTVQVWGQKRTPATDTALILGLESVFAALAGWLGLGQSLSAPRVAGCAVILAGVALAQLKGPLARAREARPGAGGGVIP